MKHWKIVLCLCALVGVSVLFGVVVGYHAAHYAARKNSVAEKWNKRERVIAEKLKLSPEQRAAAQKALDSAVKQLSDLRGLTLASEAAIVEDLVAKVEAELTPEQKQMFAALKPKPQDVTLDLLRVEPAKK